MAAAERRAKGRYRYIYRLLRCHKSAFINSRTCTTLRVPSDGNTFDGLAVNRDPYVSARKYSLEFNRYPYFLGYEHVKGQRGITYKDET